MPVLRAPPALAPCRGAPQMGELSLPVGVAGTLLLLLGSGGCAGIAAGLFGIGGGFVVVPVLVLLLPLLGADPDTVTHTAIGTSLATIVATSLRSVQAHARRGAVDFEVLRQWGPWLVAGVLAGVFLADSMRGPLLSLVFGSGVLLMAVHFLVPVLGRHRLRETMPQGLPVAGIATSLGAFSSLLGIGGGTIAVIVMTMCGRPIHQAIGTAAGFGTIIALPGALGFAFIGLDQAGLAMGSTGYVNWPAVLAISAVSTLTAPLGVALAHRLEPGLLRRIFGIYLVIVGVLMISQGLRP